MKLLEPILSDFHWYRRKAGGEWWLIRYMIHPESEAWRRPRDLDPSFEVVVEREVF